MPPNAAQQQAPLPFSMVSINEMNGGVVNVFRDAAKHESKTDGAQVKLTATQKMALQNVCREDGIGVSTFIAQAIEHKLTLRGRESKFEKYREAVFALLDSLP